MVNIIDGCNSVCNRFLAELRDREIHSDRMRFRRNLERVGEIMAYEISKTFRYMPQTVQTPINPAQVMLPAEEVVVASVLRAGLPYHQGFLNYFDAKTTQNVAGLLKLTAETFHQTLIMITHNEELAQIADRVTRLQDGRVVA